MSAQRVIEILLEYDEILSQNNLLVYILRLLGWGIIKLLAVVVDSVEGVVGKMIGLTSFFNSQPIVDLINSFKPVMFGMLGLSLAYVAYQIFLNKKFERRLVPTNILMAIIVIVLLPIGMVKLNQLTQAGVSVLHGQFNSMSGDIIDNNVTDIYLYDDNNFNSKDINPKNNIPSSQISKIDITETIDKSKTTNEKVFENEVVYNKGGGYDIEKINGLFKWDVEYFRWHCNFWTIIISLTTTAFTLILSSIKIGRLVFELAFNKVFAIIFAFTDIAHGQRLKKTIQNIISIFAVIFCMALMLKIYLLFTSWIGSQNLGIVSILAMIAVSIAVIDGPNIVEQIFGIDAGLSSAWKTIAGTYAAAKGMSELTKGAARVGSGLGKFISSAGGNLASAGAGALGMSSGLRENIKNSNLEQQMKDKESKAKGKERGSAEPLEKQMKDQGLNQNAMANKDMNNDGHKNTDGNLDKVSGNIDDKSNDLDSSNSGNDINSNDNRKMNLDTSTNGQNSSNDNIARKETGEKDLLGKMDNSMNSREDKKANLESQGLNKLGQDNNLKNSLIDDISSNKDIDNKANINEDLKQSISDSANSLNTNLKSNPMGSDSLNSNGLMSDGSSKATGTDFGGDIISSLNDPLGTNLNNMDSHGNSLGSDSILGKSDILSGDSLMSDGSSKSMGAEFGGDEISSLNDPLGANLNNMDSHGNSLGSDSILGKSDILSGDSLMSKGSGKSMGSEFGGDKISSMNEPLSTRINDIGSKSDNLGRDTLGSINRNENSTGTKLGVEESATSNGGQANVTKNNIIETRTIGDYAKDKINKSSIGQLNTRVKRSYQIGKNTTVKMGEKNKNKGGKK